MAIQFKNFTAESIGTTPETVYTVPSSTTSVAIGLNLANRIGTSITVDVLLGTTFLIKQAEIPPGLALSTLDGKLILETGDAISVVSSDSSSVDVILSVSEQT